MDDVLDRGDHGVGGLVEDLRVLVGRRCEYGHALVGVQGVGDSSTHRSHLVLGGARVASGANHEHGRAVQRSEVGSEFAVDCVHLDHDVRRLGGRHPGRATEHCRDPHEPPQPTKLGADLLLSGLVEHGDRVSTVDEHQSADQPGVPSRVSHRDRGAVRPPDEDRAFDPGRLDHPSDVVDGRLCGVVGRSARLPARPRVEPHRAVLPVETADDAAPVLHGAEAAAEEEQGGRAARGVDGVEPSVCGRNGELS